MAHQTLPKTPLFAAVFLTNAATFSQAACGEFPNSARKQRTILRGRRAIICLKTAQAQKLSKESSFECLT